MRGPCGEKVGHYTSVPASRVSEDMATGTYIRWLVSQDDGARAYYMRLFTMEPGAHINAHYHPWEHEIFVLKGEGRVRIGKKVYSVRDGFFIYIPPNVEHEYWADSELQFLCIIPSRPTAERTEKPQDC